MGVEDFIRVVCTDVTHKGCILMGGLGRVTTVPRRKTVQLRRISVHVATGLRLRRRLDPTAAPRFGCERGPLRRQCLQHARELRLLCV